jgi:hypothetical protein
VKAKTIAKVLASKHASWVKSITDPEVQKVANDSTIITGGCIPSLLLNTDVNDFDIYFRSPEAALTIAQYYAKVFTQKNGAYRIEARIEGDRVKLKVDKSKNVEIAGDVESLEDTDNVVPNRKDGTDVIEEADAIDAATLEKEAETKRYQPLFLSSNAITLSTKVQLIIRFTGEPESIHENYDFVHCTNYWCSWDGQLTFRKEALEAILTKELRYVGSKYPICSVIRTRKFLARGWTINAGQYVKMCFQISLLDLTNIEVLKDQLVGVDSAYFNTLISELKKKQFEDSSFVLDQGYLISIIDRIF